jgi:hypothetical protein
VDFVTTKYTCTSVSRRTQNFRTGNNIVSPNFVVVVAEVVSLVGMDMVIEVVVFDLLVSENIVTCYATEHTHFELLLRLFTNLTLQSVIPLYYIYPAYNLTHKYFTEHYPCRPTTANSVTKLFLQALKSKSKSKSVQTFLFGY